MSILDLFRAKKAPEQPKKKVIINNITKQEASYSGYSNNYGSRGGGEKYASGLSGYGGIHYINNELTRINARKSFHDSVEAKGVIIRFADTVIGTGLKLDCTPQAEMLGLSPEEAEAWRRDVNDRFHAWAKSKQSSRNGINNFYQNQRLYAIFQHRDNDMFTRFYYSSDKNLSNPLQIQFLDPQQIGYNSYLDTYGSQSEYNDGIKRDQAGKEIGYEVYQKDSKAGGYKSVSIPAVGKSSGRTMMIHGFMPEYSSQGRGYSRLEHALQDVHDMTDFKMSTVKKAISQSQVTMYTKPSKDDDASNPMEDIAQFKAGPTSLTETSTEDVVVNNIVEGCSIEYEKIPEAAANVPGQIGVFNLKKGEDLVPFNTQQQGESHAEFIDNYMSYISASISMPIEVLKMKFGSNYSASRGALLLFWGVAEIWREEMNADLNDPIFESWLSEEIASGRVKAPGFSDPRLRKAWLECRWVGSPMPNIDPMRTAKAEMAYATMGATNLDRIAQEYNGSDGRTNRQKLTKQYEELPFAKWDFNAPNLDDDDLDKKEEDD